MSNNNSVGELQTVSPEIIAHDFHVATEGKLEEKVISATKKSILATSSSYPAKGSVASFMFYLQFQVNVTNGKSFNGKAGGISSPGGGALFGDVYTNDINKLYWDTVSFQFNWTPVYTSLIFFDKHSNALGTYQSGSVSTVLGTGGGSGKWS